MKLGLVSAALAPPMPTDAHFMPTITINGREIPNIRAAAELLKTLEEELIVIEFEDNRNTTIVLNRQEIEREHDQIKEDNGIVNSASKDLRDVWQR